MTPEPEEERNRRLRQAGIMMGLPASMLATILVGYFLGAWVDNRFHTAPWGLLVFILLGIGAAFREVFGILKKTQK